MMEIVGLFTCGVAFFDYLAFNLFKDSSKKVISFVEVLASLVNIYLFYEFSGIYKIKTFDERLIFFTQLIRPIIFSDEIVILLIIFTIFTVALDNHQVLRVNSNILRVILEIVFLSVLARQPETLEKLIIWCTIELTLMTLIFNLRNLSFTHKLGYIIPCIIFKTTISCLPIIEFDSCITVLILVFDLTLKAAICIVFHSLSFLIYEQLYEENRRLLLLKSYSKISNNYLFYFYYGGKALKRHSKLLTSLLIMALVNYLLNILLFSHISLIAQFSLIYTGCIPLGYLLSLRDDSDINKNTTLNCMFLIISLVLLTY